MVVQLKLSMKAFVRVSLAVAFSLALAGCSDAASVDSDWKTTAGQAGRLARRGHLSAPRRPLRRRRSEQRPARRAGRARPLSGRRLAGRHRSPRLPEDARRHRALDLAGGAQPRDRRQLRRATTATGSRTSRTSIRTSATWPSCASWCRRRTPQGFKVILDIVTNHVAQLFYYDINGNGSPDENVYGAGCGEQSPANTQPCPGGAIITHVTRIRSRLRSRRACADTPRSASRGWRRCAGSTIAAIDRAPTLPGASAGQTADAAVRLSARRLVSPQGAHHRLRRARAGADRRLPRRPEGSGHRARRRARGAHRGVRAAGSRRPTSTASASTR